MDQEPKANGKSSATAYAELRRLLLGPERDEISHLQNRLDDPQLRAEDLSEVLPAAVRLRAAKGPALRSALRPLVEDSIRSSIEKHPRVLVECLTPILGTALRRAVSAWLGNLLQAANETVERNLSWRSLRWHWESMRTGKRFTEIALRRSQLYQVERVFLVHKRTGLVLEQCSAEVLKASDHPAAPDLVAAIQDVARGSFDIPGDEFETFRAGSVEVRVRHAPHAILAAVIRGRAPREVSVVLQAALERISTEKSSYLEHFDGDTANFASSREYLKVCLLGEGGVRPKRTSALIWVAGVVALAAIALWIGITVREQGRWNAFLDRLGKQPGVVVTSTEKHGNFHVIHGLRDPIAVDPASLLAGTGIDPKMVDFHLEPYHSLEPVFEASRRLTNETLLIEGQTLYFGPDSTELSEEDIGVVTQIAAQMRALLATARTLDKRARIRVLGHTDDAKATDQSMNISLARAEDVRNALIASGVPPGALAAEGMGTSQPLRNGVSDTDKLFNRYVSFRVVLSQ